MSNKYTKVTEFKPPVMASSLYSNEPAIFLAGPIQGAPDWQMTAFGIIAYVAQQTELSVYNPRVPDLSTHTKVEQMHWEKTHLARARQNGAILFWFAAKDESLDYPINRCYAQTSRIEFGRAMGWMDFANTNVNVALGIEPAYSGGNEDYIRDCAEEFGLPVHAGLEPVCRYAVKLALGNK